MQKNRFFKSTFGAPAEYLIAQALDTSAGAVAGAQAAGTLSVTVAANTTANDILAVTVGPHTIEYKTPGETAANFATNLQAALTADPYSVANGIVWTHTGTTSLVLTATFPAGAIYNGTPTSISAPTNTGPSFSAMSVTAVTGGRDAVVGMQPDYKSFVANASNGALGVYWDDTNLVLNAGDTKNPANLSRKFFYAWKQGGGVAMRTAAIPVKDVKYTTVAYAAGTAQQSTITFGGTYAVGQILHVRFEDTTSTIIPYPNYSYETPYVTDLTTTLTNLAALINAETADQLITATSTSTTIVATATNTTTTFKMSFYLETTPAQPTDLSAVTFTYGTPGVAPIGTLADVQEFEKYFNIQNGVMNYTPEGTRPDEFGQPVTNAVTGINYGFVVVTAYRNEPGVVRDYNKKTYIVVALPDSSKATLANF